MNPKGRYESTRRRFLQTTGVVTGATVLGVGATGVGAADASNNPAMPGRIYADDEVWGTRPLTVLPPPKGNNAHSFDKFFIIMKGVSGQLNVGEAAPGERDFNGGRWVTYTATWKQSATPVILTSDDDVWYHYQAGHLDVSKGSPSGGPPPYFECPLIPLQD